MSELANRSAARAHVVICQKRLVHYRTAFFDRLRERLDAEGVRLSLVLGEATEAEASRRDGGELPWAHLVKLRSLPGGRVYWQPLPKALGRVDLLVVTQENKIASNYARQLLRPFTARRLAFWGHGRNFQSDRPEGWQERWKRLWIGRVDWWLAYTSTSARAVAAQGFPGERITVLNNAIDGESFRADLEGIGTGELADFRARHGIVDGAPVGIYCGSLYADKRLALLVQAGELLVARDPRFRLLVLGAGPEEEWLQQAASARPWLRLLGMRKGADKALAFRAAQLLLNPGAVGLHVIDSFVSGLPLLTLREAGHGPEVDYLEDGRNALLLESDDAASFAGAAIAVFEDATRLATLRTECLALGHVYTLDAMVENFTAGVIAALAAPKR